MKRTIIKVLHEKSLLRYAIVQHKVDDQICKSLNNVPSHGESNTFGEPYYRTKPSVVEKIKKMDKNKTPKNIVKECK